jgi:crossover junction endodeoxyribonuclease RusA
MIESSKNVEPWREAVKYAALMTLPTGWVRLDGPLQAQMVFTLHKPVSAPKRRRTWPDRYPDLSKLIRSTEDALTDAGAWADDARVVRYVDTGKVFPGEDPDALPVPGAVIRVWQVTE